MKKQKTIPSRVSQTPIALSTLRPLPVRITQRQYLRLVAHREIDQLAIQEHVRRALDLYLDDLDWRRTIQMGNDPGSPPSQMSSLRKPEVIQNPGEAADENTETSTMKASPKLVYR